VDLGPGPDSTDAVQIVVLDLVTGQRTQVTRLPPGTPYAPSVPVTGFPWFIDNETVAFFTWVDPDGLNPEHAPTIFTVRIDGSRLRLKPAPHLSRRRAPGSFRSSAWRNSPLTSSAWPSPGIQ